RKALSSRLAHAWLSRLGWYWNEVHKGIYKDGHERDDIKQYRNLVFLPQLQALKSRMMEWDKNLLIILKVLEAEVKPVIFITYDKSTFNSNNRQKILWIYEDQVPICKKRLQTRSTSLRPSYTNWKT
ncbi:hypothetical protein L873DRAFT_1694133, partial [Choiromyces venosus 120613-1]